MSSFEPQLADEPHGFATLPSGTALPEGLEPLATFVEFEGLSIVARATDLVSAGLAHDNDWACISLGLVTRLDELGVTARISAALADAGISCNVVAAYHHDHIFVPWKRRDEALDILKGL